MLLLMHYSEFLYSGVRRVKRNKSKEHCSLSAYAILCLGLGSMHPNLPKWAVESKDEEQDMKLGFLSMDKNLRLGLIAEAANGQSH